MATGSTAAGPITGHLALTLAATFTGAAVFITAAEQPARLLLDDQSLLTQWKASYARGLPMQGMLVVVSSALGFYTAWKLKDWKWYVGSGIIALNWPYTLLFILPTNNLLNDAPTGSALTTQLIVKWGSLHAIRAAISTAAVGAFLWALNPCVCSKKAQ